MKKRLLTAIAAALTIQVNAQTYTPVTVTGFTADVIANGSGPAANSTTVDMDGVGYNLVAQNYVGPSSQTPTAFLPTSGLINSLATSGLSFQLAPYTGNNSLRLVTGTSSGTLTFTTPQSADQIYLLTTSVYTSTFTATVNFTDGTNQAFTGQSVNGWIVGTGTVASQNIGRVLRSTDVLENPTGAPRLFQLALTTSSANINKPIQSITFTKTSTATNERLHILGITVKSTGSALATDAGVTAITAPNSGCVLTSQETITVAVKNSGTTAQSNIPVSYTINTGTPVNEVVAGPIAPNTTVNYSFNTKANLSTAGTFNLSVRTNLTGDLAPGNDVLTRSVVLSAAPAMPTITAGGSTTICTGGSVVLTAASATPGVTYQWLNNGTVIANATNPTYTANTAGSYTAKAVLNGCTSTASTATTITVTTSPVAPGINANGSLTLCSGDSVIFTAASATPGATFNWFKDGNLITGATTATYIAKTAGSYTATAVVNSCNSPASLARVVAVKQRPAKPNVTKTGAILTSSSTTGNQWYKNGIPISGATASSLNASSNGSYTVVVTANGCKSEASNAVIVNTTGVADDKVNLQVAVYPNPSSGLFSVSLPEGQTYQLQVTDLTGKVIHDYAGKAKNMLLDLNGAAKGVYMLKIVSENKTAMRKLVVE